MPLALAPQCCCSCAQTIDLPPCVGGYLALQGRELLVVRAIGPAGGVQEGLYEFGCAFERSGQCWLRWMSPDLTDQFQLRFVPGLAFPSNLLGAEMGFSSNPDLPCDSISRTALPGSNIASTNIQQFLCNELVASMTGFGSLFNVTLLLP